VLYRVSSKARSRHPDHVLTSGAAINALTSSRLRKPTSFFSNRLMGIAMIRVMVPRHVGSRSET
jgi:LmbE family N-acetylglucosaminyl deacetylase